MPKKKTVNTSPSSHVLRANIYNTKGEVVRTVTAPKELFDVKVDKALLAQYVRVYLANQRAGTHSTKTRSEVIGSTRKIYRQKGTGRARHGSIKAPIFIGGGIAHGPKPKDYSLTVPQKMKELALLGALTDKFLAGNIRFVEGISEIPPKTKEMFSTLQNLKMGDKNKKNILLILAGKNRNALLSGRNISYLNIILANTINAYQVLTHHNLVFEKEALEVMKKSLLPSKVSADVAPSEVEKVSTKSPGKKSLARKVTKAKKV